VGEVLVHLHPDFAGELDWVLQAWNRAQNTLTFRGIRPSLDLEAQLLSPGASPLEETLHLADIIRKAEPLASREARIIVFTEKRIFEGLYYQLYFGGSDGRVSISLDFTRKLFENHCNETGYVFRTILSNILCAVAQEEGFDTHDDTRGCILDFCNNMPDIIRGIEQGPAFCKSHLDQISRRNKTFLLRLVETIRNTNALVQQDTEITRKVNSFGSPVEVGIVVALREEFREVFARIQSRATPVFKDDIDQNYYVFETGTGNTSYRCATTFIGGMGIDKAALAGDRLMADFHPATIVNIGIAGSMDPDVRAGDVVVAAQCNNYLATAKAIAGKYAATFDFQLSGDPYKSTPAYIAHVRNLEFANAESMQKWREGCSQRLSDLGPNQERLLAEGFVSGAPIIHEGNIASGSIVGASEVFAEWLKDRGDRKYLAIEMEAAGVMAAAFTRSTKTLVIRGISDFSDSRKSELDRSYNGSLRRYGMNNAIDLLWLMLDLQLLTHTRQ
jgi:nucleoside phosphorylase